MIIVWLSIALVVIALIWLVVRVIKESKAAMDKVIRCSKSAEILRKNTESILIANEKLQETTGNMVKSIGKKGEDLIHVKDQSVALAGTLMDTKDQLVDAYKTLSNKIEV